MTAHGNSRTDNDLSPLRSQREQLDVINLKILDLLAERMEICREVAKIKALDTYQ